MTNVIQKVTAFITRKNGADVTELLIFQHPTAGVQLPAGTVEAGETLPEAAYREVAEETGLTAVELRSHLGTINRTLAGDQRALLQNANFLIGPQRKAKPLNFRLGRGNWLRVLDEVDGFAEVVFEESDLNFDPPKVQTRISGWLPTEILATQMERAFFHFALTTPTPEKWDQAADRHIFALYWVPLVPKPTLVQGQHAWLDYVYDLLLKRVNLSE